MTQARTVLMSDNAPPVRPHALCLKRMGIDTYQEPVI